jgi:DNA topoisomerase-1
LVAEVLHDLQVVPGLRYILDDGPGIRRLKRGRGFVYVRPDGQRVGDAATRRRIASLVIPPAWTDVWIAPHSLGHVQATGRDARGRKQHRYHPRWVAVRDAAKYSRTIAFGQALPALRRRVRRDLASPGMTRQKVLALVVRLLERTLIRVGNDEYAAQNGSFGLTTIRDRHAQVRRASIRFRFRGKSGKMHDVSIGDRRLARLVKQCQELPGSQLFQYRDDRGRVRRVGSADVNAYLRAAMGEAFTAKDVRTWAGTVLAATAFYELAQSSPPPAGDVAVVRAIDAVAAVLGNTRAVCRRCYVHPEVLAAYQDGSLVRALEPRPGRTLRRPATLRPIEASVLSLLRRRSARSPRRRGSPPVVQRAQPRTRARGGQRTYRGRRSPAVGLAS